MDDQARGGYRDRDDRYNDRFGDIDGDRDGERGDKRGRGRGARGGNGGGGAFPRRKVCPFCADKNLLLDYKDTTLLRRFVTDRGKMIPRRITGVCAKHQRALSLAIKRARNIALMPFTVTGR
jgi:small subunit ribosomal protein S18